MQSETEYFRRVYEATYEDMLRYTVIKTRRAGSTVNRGHTAKRLLKVFQPHNPPGPRRYR